MTRDELERIDFEDWTFAGEVAKAVAAAIGWTLSPERPDQYLFEEKGEETGFYVWNSEFGPWFSPLEEEQHALVAAGRMCRTRRVTFELVCTPDGMWRASFSTGGQQGGATGLRNKPAGAVCEAVLRLSKQPDPQRLFRR